MSSQAKSDQKCQYMKIPCEMRNRQHQKHKLNEN